MSLPVSELKMAGDGQDKTYKGMIQRIRRKTDSYGSLVQSYN